MILPRIVELQLLSKDEESDILVSFPLDAKIIMIKATNEHLLSNIQASSSTLLSQAHVSWVMELIGQGFTLPITSGEIIQGSTRIYSEWLNDPSMRPAVIINNGIESPMLQQFFQVCFTLIVENIQTCFIAF